jgi:broad specificity phosphatase PhoE
MTFVWLVRHGAHDLLGKRLVGRTPGVILNAAGHQQTEALVAAFAPIPLAAVYSSPLERTRLTAGPVAESHGLRTIISPGINEVDFGIWTGLSFAELANDPEWSQWNSHRDTAAIPFGETMPGVQGRAIAALLQMAETHREKHVAVFSHGDTIRGALAYYRGIPLRQIELISFNPGDVALLRIHATRGAFCGGASNEELSAKPRALAEVW